MSNSTYHINITLLGIGNVKLELYRALAPLTVQKLAQALPTQSRAIKRPKELHIPLKHVIAGAEHEKIVFDRGEVAFDPRNSELLIFLEDEPSTIEPYNYVGKVVSGLDLVEKTRLSVGVNIELEN